MRTGDFNFNVIQIIAMNSRISKKSCHKHLGEEKQFNCSNSNRNIIQRQYIESAHSQRCLALIPYFITEQRLILMGFLRKKYLSIFEQEQLALLEKSKANRRKCRYCMEVVAQQGNGEYFCKDCGNCVDFGFAAGMVGGEQDA